MGCHASSAQSKKRTTTHVRWTALTLAVPLMLLVSGSPPSEANTTTSPSPPNQLVILSLTDVKGKTSPCGCHIPKGGLARQATFVDSLHAEYKAVLLVDGGGFFPEDDLHEDAAWFLMDAMNVLGIDAAGVGDRELRFGYARVRDHASKAKLSLVSANLNLSSTHAFAFAPYVIRNLSGVRVGIFGLISDKADLGPARDSLTVSDPAMAAKRTIAELRAKGATVVVLLSQLGKVETEDLVAAVDGIDVAVLGRRVPLVQKGRMIKNTVAVYGGEQGQYMGRTRVTLDGRGRMTSGENEMFMLGPEVGENKAMAALVRGFEDAFNEKLRKSDKGEAAKAPEAASTK